MLSDVIAYRSCLKSDYCPSYSVQCSVQFIYLKVFYKDDISVLVSSLWRITHTLLLWKLTVGTKDHKENLSIINLGSQTTIITDKIYFDLKFVCHESLPLINKENNFNLLQTKRLLFLSAHNCGYDDCGKLQWIQCACITFNVSSTFIKFNWSALLPLACV